MKEKLFKDEELFNLITPRTDRMCGDVDSYGDWIDRRNELLVDAEVARQLERELTLCTKVRQDEERNYRRALAQLDEFAALNRELAEALRGFRNAAAFWAELDPDGNAHFLPAMQAHADSLLDKAKEAQA